MFTFSMMPQDDLVLGGNEKAAETIIQVVTFPMMIVEEMWSNYTQASIPRVAIIVFLQSFESDLRNSP